MRKLAVLVTTMILAVHLAACATTINQKLLDENLTRTYPSSKAECFKATLSALKDFGTPVESSDSKSGKIMTARTEAVRNVVASHGNYSSVASLNVAHHRYFLAVEGDKKKCVVKTTKYQVWENNVELKAINKKWAETHLWAPLFNEIGDRLGVVAELPQKNATQPVY